MAADMLLDILSDRGFSGAYIVNERIIPARINPDTWNVENETDLIHKFRCVSAVVVRRAVSQVLMAMNGTALLALAIRWTPSGSSHARSSASWQQVHDSRGRKAPVTCGCFTNQLI